MDPYRTPWPPQPETSVAPEDEGCGLAFGVLTLAGAVQVAVAHRDMLSAQTLFGAACCVAGLAWFLRHRRP